MAEDMITRAAFFANGRCTAVKFCKPPEQQFAETWYPRIGGQFVRPEGMPQHGYDTRAEAIEGARWFKAYARDVLQRAQGEQPVRSDMREQD